MQTKGVEETAEFFRRMFTETKYWKYGLRKEPSLKELSESCKSKGIHTYTSNSEVKSAKRNLRSTHLNIWWTNGLIAT